MADDPEKPKIYKLKAGHEHSYIHHGERVMAFGDKGHGVPLTAAQLASFADKFEGEGGELATPDTGAEVVGGTGQPAEVTNAQAEVPGLTDEA